MTFLGHSKDSLWSLDLFRCESLFMRSHWVMAVIDQYSRRIVGFAVHAGVLDGPGVCRMLNRVLAAAGSCPAALSTDHDPLFEFHRWKANLRVLEIAAIKSVPLVPMSHPFIERLIGTVSLPRAIRVAGRGLTANRHTQAGTPGGAAMRFCERLGGCAADAPQRGGLFCRGDSIGQRAAAHCDRTARSLPGRKSASEPIDALVSPQLCLGARVS